jgi:ElaB/YqjD/DUF883 family membrane-anchored ribosome-binding protein
MNENTNTSSAGQSLHTAAGAVGQMANRAADQADLAIHKTQRATNDALDALSERVDQMQQRVPAALSRGAAKVETLARRGLNVAHDTTAKVREQMHRTSDNTVHYIQDQPVKSVLIAAAAGAGLALVLGWLTRHRHD